MNILIVEPNKLLSGLYKSVCLDAGHEVRIASSGQEAIELCDILTPDAIVLELQMAGNNGIAFLHELRSYIDWRKLPVVLHTFVAKSKVPADVRRQFGIVRHFYKPDSNIVEIVKSLEGVTPEAIA